MAGDVLKDTVLLLSDDLASGFRLRCLFQQLSQQNRWCYRINEDVAPSVMQLCTTAVNFAVRHSLSLSTRADDTFSAVETENLQTTNRTLKTILLV